MNKLAKTMLGVAAASSVLGSAISTGVLAWGDSASGRRTYTLEEINGGILGDTIVLNSINDKNAMGDERNFVNARFDNGDHGVDNVWEADEITVENGKNYIVSLYVHNNNPKGEEAIAKDVTTTFSIPGTSASSVEVNGLVSSSNATPNKYWDNVVFKSADGSKFHLEYIAGSALLENNGIGANGGVKLSDDIISKGVKIGYSALDGNIPGCYQYSGYVSVTVKAVFDEEPVSYDFNKQVRLVGETEWHESVNAKIGDKVEFQIVYKNTSSETQTGVILRDSLPTNLSMVENTLKVYNAAHKDGLAYSAAELADKGINLGAYTAGSNAIVRFTAEVKDASLGCGKNTMTNWAQIFVNTDKSGDAAKNAKSANGANDAASANGLTKKDDASVVTTKTCENPVDPTDPVTPPVLPETGLTGIATSALGLGSLTTALGYYISSKKRA